MNRKKKHKPNYKSFRKKIPISEKTNNSKFIKNGAVLLIVSILFIIIFKYYSRQTFNEPPILYLIMLIIGLYFSIKENLDVVKFVVNNKVNIIREYLGLILLIIIYSIKNSFLYGSIIYTLFQVTNQIYSESSQSQSFDLEIIDVNRHSTSVSSSIVVKFQGKQKNFFTEDKVLLELEKNKQSLSNARLRLYLKEGIFGCYTIENEYITR